MRTACWTEAANPAALARDLAKRVAACLLHATDARGRAVIAVSGGTTPGRFFDALSEMPVDWSKVTVTLVDERFVPPENERSNEKLVRERLLKNAAANARFQGLWTGDEGVEAAARAAADRIAALPTPIDIVVLGMGADGHTASYFTDAPNLERLTDPAEPATVLPVETTAGGEPRLTLTMPLIAQARLVVLHIEGDEKKAVAKRAIDGAPLGELPVATIFDHATHPVEIFWAPK